MPGRSCRYRLCSTLLGLGVSIVIMGLRKSFAAADDRLLDSLCPPEPSLCPVFSIFMRFCWLQWLAVHLDQSPSVIQTAHAGSHTFDRPHRHLVSSCTSQSPLFVPPRQYEPPRNTSVTDEVAMACDAVDLLRAPTSAVALRSPQGRQGSACIQSSGADCRLPQSSDATPY
jgi:hypothetical protein